jgi:F-box domain
MFFAMPNEIQVHILWYLEASDILALRLASRSLRDLLQLNASVVSRTLLPRTTLGDDPVVFDCLYRQPVPLHSLDYFLQLMHREQIVFRMVSIIADYIQIKIYQVKSTSRRKQFAPSRVRMERRFKACAFIIYHFLETLRIDLLSHSKEPDGHSRQDESAPEESGTAIQSNILNRYPEELLLPAFQFYRIMVSAYRQKLRPPTYAGTIERKLRGWDRTPASDADVAQVLIYGGMEEVLKIMLCATYSARLQALNVAIDRINGRTLPVGSRWMEGKSNPKVIRDLDIPNITYIQFMSQNSNVKLRALYLPWLRTIVAKQRAAKDAADDAEFEPEIPSPFVYIEDVLKDRATGRISGETSVTVEDFAARANAPDEDEEQRDDVSAGPASPVQGPAMHHRALSFPTPYG